MDRRQFIDIIDSSDLFDDRLYAACIGSHQSRLDLIAHYLKSGDEAGICPALDFDPRFYRDLYGEDGLRGDNALVDYLVYGKTVWRYRSARHLRSDAQSLDRDGIASLLEDATLGGAASLEHYLLANSRPLIETGLFDEAFYVTAYPDAGSYAERPLMHHIKFGRRQRRVRTPGELDHRKRLLSPHFDPEHYLGQFGDRRQPSDPLEHYVLEGARLGLEPSPDFNPDYYMRSNPNLRSMDLDPFHHYIYFGKEQGLEGKSSDPKWQSCADLILASGLFDEPFYQRATSSGLAGRELVFHYLLLGEPTNVAPHATFDPMFYYEAYTDVDRYQSALLHYLETGRKQWRYTCRDDLLAESLLVEESNIFLSQIAAESSNMAFKPPLSSLESLLLRKSVDGIRNGVFDEQFYVKSYPDAVSYPHRPLRHYIDFGRWQNRIRTADELQFRRGRVETSFDRAFYDPQVPSNEKHMDLLDHYLLHGVRRGLAPCPDLSVDYYLRRYADLDGMLLDPFQHFVEFGRSEGRAGILPYANFVQAGERPFDEAKKTVFLGLHDGSRTGAPLLGLLVADRLSNTHNVIVYLFNGGELVDDLKEVCCLLVSPCHIVDTEHIVLKLMASYAIEYILYNSIEAGALAEVASNVGLPCVGLIHEFSEYTKPSGRMVSCVELTDRVIVPSELIAASLQREAGNTRSSRLNNICIQPQGRLPYLPLDRRTEDLSPDDLRALLGVEKDKDCKIVLGAGHVQMRKGVDLFIQTAAAVAARWKGQVRFLWIGGGYDPERDLHYSVWLADMLARLQLKESCFFISPQSTLDHAFEIADVFYLSSRLDPFPNVVLDALHANKPVVCFKDATGVASLFEDGRADGAAAPFCDVDGAANAIIRLFRENGPSRNKEVAEREFDFDTYIEIIQRELMRAGAKKRRILDISEKLQDDDTFDLSFCEGRRFLVDQSNRVRSIRKYVARGQNGVSWTNPRPGFNDGSRRAASGMGLEVGGYGASAAPSAPKSTHDAIDLDRASIAGGSPQKTAIHIHLFYSDLAEEFRRRLERAKCRADLFITTSSEESELKIKQCFKGYTGGEVRILRGKNRGRDVAPLILDVLPLIVEENYDVFAHLHGKKSLIVSEAFGDRWRDFSLQTLIGNAATSSKILGLFQAKTNLGLVFPEDRHAIGWTQNKQFGERLANRLSPPLELPSFPIFPIGTMFWARPRALQSLLDLKLTAVDFPSEPLPYDGTMLHAIERMLPALCEHQGFSWLTVYRRSIIR